MEFRNLKVTVLTKADASDPLNQTVVVGATATVNGKRCGWRADGLVGEDWHETFSQTIGHLILKILAKPDNELVISGVPEPVEGIRIEIPDVLVAA